MTPKEREEIERLLRSNLSSKAAEIAELLGRVSDHWGYEDPIYRFYHQSYKVYSLQQQTETIVAMLRSLLPDQPLNPWFAQIISQGTGKQFTPADNERWVDVTRPILEAFFHARFFLEMANRYHEPTIDEFLPSGWAALLYLFNLR